MYSREESVNHDLAKKVSITTWANMHPRENFCQSPQMIE